MTHPVQSRLTLADVRYGFRTAFGFAKADTLTSLGFAAALAAVTVLADTPVWLGLVLVASQLANVARIVLTHVFTSREARDFEQYITEVMDNEFRYENTVLDEGELIR